MGLQVEINQSPQGVTTETGYLNIPYYEYINDGSDLGPRIRYQFQVFASQAARFAEANAQPLIRNLGEIPAPPAGTAILPHLYGHLKTFDYAEPKLKHAVRLTQAQDVLNDPPRPPKYTNPDDIPGGAANPLHPKYDSMLQGDA